MNYIICGEIASGKDTVAELLPGTRMAFADDFKVVCRLLRIRDIYGAFNFMETLFNGNEPKDYRKQLRKFMEYPVEQGKDRRLYQDIGMWSRQSYPDIWIDAVKRRIQRTKGSIVITDCRFYNELAAFPDFHSIYVDCSEELRMQRMVARDGEVKQGSLGHAAEQEIQGLKELCNVVVVNEGSLDDLRVDVDSALAYMNFKMTN